MHAFRLLSRAMHTLSVSCFQFGFVPEPAGRLSSSDSITSGRSHNPCELRFSNSGRIPGLIKLSIYNLLGRGGKEPKCPIEMPIFTTSFIR